nr:DsbE family thiol:disulfide interchange protein [uncultured Devosia sp.]
MTSDQERQTNPTRRLILAALPLVALVGVVGVFAFTLGNPSTDLPSVLVDKPAPDFALPPLSSTLVPGFQTSDLIGQISVVNVFASWCLPCRDEHPFLVELKSRTSARLYGINLKDEDRNAIAFLDELGNPYDAIGADRNGRTAIDWGVYGVPETFLIRGDGRILTRHVGPLDRASLDDLVATIERERAGQ